MGRTRRQDAACDPKAMRSRCALTGSENPGVCIQAPLARGRFRILRAVKPYDDLFGEVSLMRSRPSKDEIESAPVAAVTGFLIADFISIFHCDACNIA